MLSKENVKVQRRRELLHKRWTDKVYEPIARHISDEMYSGSYATLASKKRDIYRQYLELYNKKV